MAFIWLYHHVSWFPMVAMLIWLGYANVKNLHRSHIELFWMGGKDQLHDVNVESSHVQQLGHGGRFPDGPLTDFRPIFRKTPKSNT